MKISFSFLFALVCSLAAGDSLHAASGTWSGTTDSTWTNAANWSASPVPGTGDTATFNNAGNVNTTISLAGGVTNNTIFFDTANAAAYTIGSGAAGSQTLILNNGGAITVNSTVASNQLFNSAITLGTDRSLQTYAFTDNSGQLLTIAGNLAGAAAGGTAGNKTLAVSGAGNTTISGNIANGGATTVVLTKSGTGTLTLSGGANNYSGATIVNAGTLAVSSVSVGGYTANLIVGNSAGSPAIMDILPGANVTYTNLAIGENATAPGAVFQSGGTLTLAQAASIADFRIGDGTSSYGYYQLSGGTLNAKEVGVGGGNGGSATAGVMDIIGGTFNDTGWITIGRGGTTSSGILNVFGNGVIQLAGTTGRIGIDWAASSGGLSVINIFGGGTIIGPASTTYVLDLASGNTAGTMGIANLGSNGTLAIGGVAPANANPTTLINFNGGTLKATINNAAFMTSANIDGVYVYPGGATINDGGFNITDSVLLRSPTGYGVSSIAVTSGGSGYIAPPIVKLTGGGGSGATASAQINFTSGAVTNILISNPGSGYGSGDVLTVTFNGGGGSGAVVNTPVLAANASGGLTKTGAGTLTVSGANTFTGDTIVSNGTLALGAGGSLASTNIFVSGGATFNVSAISFTLGASQSLLGSGTNSGAVGTVSGSKIFAGTDGGIGTNTFTGNLTFASGASCYFDLNTNANSANDKIILNGASSVLTCGGASIAIKCGTNLDQANDYTLFSVTGGSASVVGSFNAFPVWTGTTPTNSSGYSIVTLGNSIVLHYAIGVTNPPAVTNLAASSVLAATATLNGQMLSTGGQFPTVKIYYGTGDGGTNPAAWTTNVSLGLQNGAFAAAASNLTANTTYYFTAFASNSAGGVWAAPSRSFTTLAVNPAVVTNFPASNVQGASAILNGQVLSIGNQTPAVTLYYGTSNGGTNTGAWANNVFIGQQSGAYTITITGLNTNTPYYFTAAAMNSDGTFWAQPALTFTTLLTAPVVSMLTFQINNTRNGANTNETLLTPSTVNTNNFGRLMTYAADGSIFTQPLYVPNVVIPGQGTHNVVYVATEHDTVYAFDADNNTGANGGVLWQTNLGISAISYPNNNGEFGARFCGNCFPDIRNEVGITGTPVIDPATGTLYVNVFTREMVAGVSTNFYHRMHALNITNGTERSFSPVVVTASVPATGVDSVGGVMTFNPKQNNQRPALTLAGGIVYAAYAGYADTDPYHGWVIGFNATNLVQLTNSVFNTTPNATIAGFGAHAAEGGIWMSGDGLCVDADTNIYFMSGNGSFDGTNGGGGNYADSLIKLSTTNKLAVNDYFTPFNELALSGNDQDLGAAGLMLLPDEVGGGGHPHLLVAGSKGGEVYLLDRDNMGKYQAGSDSQIVQSFPVSADTVDVIYSTPVYFNYRLYIQIRDSVIKAYAITNGVINTNATSQTALNFTGYGNCPFISANGTNNAILWAIQSDGFNGAGLQILHAYNATNLALELYNSSQLARDAGPGAVKMITPTVANGKVYVGGKMGLAVYGYTSFLATPTISPNGQAFTNSVTVTLAEATPGAAIYYTLNGTTPTTNSLLYTAPFVVTTTLNLQAIAIKTGAANSGVASASFVNTAALGNGDGLLGQYWTNTTGVAFTNVAFITSPTLTRTDAVVNFNWSTNAPSAVIGRTNFTARWTGSVQPQYTETYTFTTVADDGVRLWVNGQLLVNDWTTRTNAATNSGAITLNSQQFYNIQLDYFQNTSNAVAQLLWSGNSTALAVIPQTQLYSYTNPPPTVVMTTPANGATYTADASVTLGADADAPHNPISKVDFYANGNLLGTLSNSAYAPSYFITTTGLGAGSYALTAVATDGSGLINTSSPVNINVVAGSGQPYGMTSNGTVTAFLNMPTTFNGSLPALLSDTGAFGNTTNRTAASGLIPYNPNTALWSDAAVKSRYLAVPNNGGVITPDEQFGFLSTNSWTFPAGTVFVKNFDLVVDETDTNVPLRRLETRLLVLDNLGGVYGVTYKWRADNGDADLLTTSLNEDIVITNATGVRTQTWYYPSPSDCLTCHTPQAGYVLGVNTRQLNGDVTYPATGNTDNQLRTLNRLGFFYPAINETNIPGYSKLSALTNVSASLEERARSYLDANCAQCHRPGSSIQANFDARYDTPLANQNIVGALASSSLGIDNAHVVMPKDIWRSVLHRRMNTTDGIKMPPLARSLIDTNAVQVMTDWINSLPGIPALAPPVITPNGGTFGPNVSVTLAPPDGSAQLYYTLNGAAPTTNSFLYAGPVLLTNSATLTAVAFETNYNNSIAVSALFTVQSAAYFTGTSFLLNGQFQLGIAGVPGKTYVLQASTNLTDWTPLSTNAATTNVFNLFDTGASNFPFRFYRTLEQ